MSTVEEAEKAVEMFNRNDINGKLLTVNKAQPRGSLVERPPRTFEPSYKIHVGNLPWRVDEARLEQLFSENGKVVNAKVVYDSETGQSRGFGFVTMASEAEMSDAIAKLDGQVLSTHTSDEVYLGQRDSPEWTQDKDALQAFDRFGKKLAEIEEKITMRNNDKKLKNRTGPLKMPYTLLYPTSEPGLTAKGIPNGISI